MKFTNIPTTILLLASVLSANATPIAKPISNHLEQAKRQDHHAKAPEFGTPPGSNNPTFTGGAVTVVGREAIEERSVDTPAKRDEQLATRNEDEGLKAERPPSKVIRLSTTDKRAKLAASSKRSPQATRTLDARKNKDIGNHIVVPAPLTSDLPLHQEPHVVGNL
ncbi:hypothetical protein HYFRA_00010557 [Hymenoscyphus fraxineus]|uniref:Uncharacterized protein n=1 Tax=Hymenoscyphus fraxineus TaxID=746836 RepID=A0A9N9PMV7_9HELO|nr:hypothetical protein HYFRA_00010557 [Hymenoscyphus fraxineus]